MQLKAKHIAIFGRMNRTVFGISTGIGLEFRAKSMGLSLSGAYLYDMRNFLSIKPVPSHQIGVKAKNTGISASIGFLFFFRHV
jgi:hypothetical protein